MNLLKFVMHNSFITITVSVDLSQLEVEFSSSLTGMSPQTLTLSAQLQIRGGIHIIFFLFLHENICCGYSLEVPPRGASNEYPQHMFLWRNKKNISIFQMKKEPYLLL